MPPSPLVRGTDVEGVIFAGEQKAVTRDRLHRKLDAAIERWVAATCLWTDNFALGDYRFVIFAIDVAPRTQVYVQLWSEPLEPVTCEVSSGRWNPPADTWLAGDRSSRIQAFGFEVGGRADNFGREVLVNSAADARDVARLVVDIMYAGFDYRGLHPISAHICYESRATLDLVLPALTPEDLTKVFQKYGYSLQSKDDDEDRPVLTLITRGVVSTVAFGDRVADEHLFRTAVVSCELPATDAEASEMRQVAERLGPGATIERSPAQMLLEFDGGITPEWLSRRVAHWTAMIVERQRQVRRARRRPPVAHATGVVH